MCIRDSLKRAAGAGAGLLKNKRDIFSLTVSVTDAVFLVLLQLCGQLQKIPDLLRRVVKKLSLIHI